MDEPSVDWSSIVAIAERRAWLLEEPETPRLNYDEVVHADCCNLSPVYQKGKAPSEIRELVRRGCDQGCLKLAAQQRRVRP